MGGGTVNVLENNPGHGEINKGKATLSSSYINFYLPNTTERKSMYIATTNKVLLSNFSSLNVDLSVTSYYGWGGVAALSSISTIYGTTMISNANSKGFYTASCSDANGNCATTGTYTFGRGTETEATFSSSRYIVIYVFDTSDTLPYAFNFRVNNVYLK